MPSKQPKLSKQGSTGKRKCVTCVIPQKPEIIRRTDSGKTQSEVMASFIQHWIINYLLYKKWKDQL
jgi:hypothetical protein